MNKLKKYFTKNLKPKHKQYEALRMVALENKTCEDAASYFGYSSQTLRNLKNLLIAGKIDFFPDIIPGPKGFQSPNSVIKKIVKLRKQNHSAKDIKKLIQNEHKISIRTIERILLANGFSKLKRRTDYERGVSKKNTFISEKATILDFNNLDDFKIDCPIAGIFQFLPYILESKILDITKDCKLPESSDISSINAILVVLLLKLMGNERLSHIQSFDHEPGLGIFAGLNVLPKATYISTYSCRTSETILYNLQVRLLKHLKKNYPEFYKSKFINLDFHSIPHFGDESEMDKVWCGSRGKRLKGANSLLAQDGSSDIILYTKADILRKNEAQEIMFFIDYWKEIKGTIDETLVFDCKLTTYKILGELDKMDPKIKFVTLRKRNKKLLKETLEINESEWEKIHLKIPKRKHQRFLVYEGEVLLNGCENPFRQIIIKDHGREKPTFVITNNWNIALQEVLEVYARRWHIENKISEFVSFFNINALSSPIMIRIQFDLFWTIIADFLYKRFAADLKRFEKNRAQTIFKKFINFPGRIEYNGNEIIIKIRKRAHTPILLGIERLNKPCYIPWLNNLPLKIIWTA